MFVKWTANKYLPFRDDLSMEKVWVKMSFKWRIQNDCLPLQDEQSMGIVWGKMLFK